jgi:hypothetical protein
MAREASRRTGHHMSHVRIPETREFAASGVNPARSTIMPPKSPEPKKVQASDSSSGGRTVRLTDFEPLVQQSRLCVQWYKMWPQIVAPSPCPRTLFILERTHGGAQLWWENGIGTCFGSVVWIRHAILVGHTPSPLICRQNTSFR